MRKNSQGFLLVEALIVSTFVSVTLLFIFTQFKAVYQSYDISFKFNTVNEIYKANNIREFLESSTDVTLFDYVTYNNFIDVSSCPTSYIPNSDFCASFFDNLDVDKVYIVRGEMQQFIDYVTFDPSFSQDFVDYVNYIKHGSGGYRLIVRFRDGKLASINIG